MAAFNILDMMNNKARAAAGTTAGTEYKEIYLSPYEVKEEPKNQRKQSKDIDKLADSFLLVGQEQPTVLARVNGEYRIIDGHRRNLANSPKSSGENSSKSPGQSRQGSGRRRKGRNRRPGSHSRRSGQAGTGRN